MAKHTIDISKDKANNGYRVSCACTYACTTATEAGAKVVAGQHLKGVVNKIKPQKSLDI